jgi:hypothetical protein
MLQLMLMLLVPTTLLLTARYLNRHGEYDESVAVPPPVDQR